MDSIVELILKIKERPAMYLGRESITCLNAFIEGWFFRSTEDVHDSDVLAAFQKTIEKKYRIKTSHSWCDIILFYSLDEHKALEKFFEEFDEHLAIIGYKSSN